MNKKLHIIAPILLIFASSPSIADEDSRQLVELPKMMQQHMMSNMRDHLVTINEILIYMANDQLDEAAEVAESRLGMSSLKSHGAGHGKRRSGESMHGGGRMAQLKPEGMRQVGTSMHRAASRFALTAQEGDIMPAYNALSEVTSSCVACHSAYRIR